MTNIVSVLKLVKTHLIRHYQIRDMHIKVTDTSNSLGPIISIEFNFLLNHDNAHTHHLNIYKSHLESFPMASQLALQIINKQFKPLYKKLIIVPREKPLVFTDFKESDL